MPPLTAEDGILSGWRGDFGEAWIEAIATAAHLEVANSRSDKKKVDLRIEDDNGEIIRIQVKATESPRKVGDVYKHNVDVETYDRLRQGGSRGFVALVVLHKPHEHWTSHTADGAEVRATCFMLELTGMPAILGGSVTLSFPPAKMLTQGSLLALFAEEGGDDAVA